MDFPIPLEFWWSTDILLIINPSAGMDQEIHPCVQGRIDSVEINPPLLKMRECTLLQLYTWDERLCATWSERRGFEAQYQTKCRSMYMVNSIMKIVQATNTDHLVPILWILQLNSKSSCYLWHALHQMYLLLRLNQNAQIQSISKPNCTVDFYMVITFEADNGFSATTVLSFS